ncbi:unnamed protein product [Coregonus sp. 'balchen']|nr:unnamed protein product [Coregonus sp. 'balchen']
MWLWALLPICLAVIGTVGIWVVFGIAVSNETVNITERFPYISRRELKCEFVAPIIHRAASLLRSATSVLSWVSE